MTKVYFFAGGGLVTASDPAQFVSAMRAISRNPAESDLRYMQDVSERCYLYNDSYIRTTTADNFLQDLIDNDFVFAVNTN